MADFIASEGGPEEEGKTITRLKKADAFDLIDQFSKAFLIFILSIFSDAHR